MPGSSKPPGPLGQIHHTQLREYRRFLTEGNTTSSSSSACAIWSLFLQMTSECHNLAEIQFSGCEKLFFLKASNRGKPLSSSPGLGNPWLLPVRLCDVSLQLPSGGLGFSVAQDSETAVMCAGQTSSASPPTPHTGALCSQSSQHSLAPCSCHQHCRT